MKRIGMGIVTKRMRRTLAAGIAGGVALLLLTSCTAPEPRNTSDSSAVEVPPPGEAAKPTPTETSTTREAVIVVAGVDVDGAHVTVSGYVNGVIEDGGSCTFELEGNASKVEAKSEGLADRLTTSCGTVSVPIAEFSKGPWVVTLRYVSVSDDVVTSEPVDLEIP